ncbi:MAG TPA: cytochrome c oxidase subunit II [Pirellulales bacterium]
MTNMLLIAAALGDTLEDVSTLHPASSQADSIRFLLIFVSAVSAFILAIVWGVLFYSILRFRRKRKAGDGTKNSSPGETTEPPQVYGSLPIEIAWTVAPGLIVFVLTLVIVRTEIAVRANASMYKLPEAAHSFQVLAVGHQWWWEYQIQQNDDQKINVVTANELHVPASGPDDSLTEGHRIFLTLKSADVCHSFWLPRLAGKTDLIPGRTNYAWFQTAETGLFLGQCAEYCGTQHANMLLRVYVDPPDQFAAWLANEQKPAVDDSAIQEGKRAFLSQTCVNCHTIRGTQAKGRFGPDLTHLAARKTIGSGMIELNHENLRQWIGDPSQIKPGCLMPAFGNLGSEKVLAITDYLMSLK